MTQHTLNQIHKQEDIAKEGFKKKLKKKLTNKEKEPPGLSKQKHKKKINLASTQANKLIAELPERREKTKATVRFRTTILESQKTC